MKKIIASALSAFLVISVAQVQAQTVAKNAKKEVKTEKKEAHKEMRKTEEKRVSVRSKDGFLSDFGAITKVTWTAGPQFDEATFAQNGVPTTAYYDYKSQLVGTTTDKKFSDLPEHAQKDIKKQYKDYVIGGVIEFKDNQGNQTNMLLYGTEFSDSDHYFVTVSKGSHEEVLKVSMDGEVSYFRKVS